MLKAVPKLAVKLPYKFSPHDIKVTHNRTFIKENTLTNCSFNMADISTSSLAASTWLTLDIEIGTVDYKQTHLDNNLESA